MARSMTCLERLYDHHAAAAVRAGIIVLLRERRVLAGSAMMWWLGRRSDLWCRGDELPNPGELLGARVAAIGEQAEVPDAVEALGQHVHEEPPNELAWLQGHGFVPVRAFEPVILVFERDTVRVGGDQAAVGDGDAMGVAGKVGQHLLWPGEGTLGIDEPVRLPQWAEVGLEGCCVGEMLVITEELEVACGMRLAQHSQHAPTKQACELQRARDSRAVRRSSTIRR